MSRLFVQRCILGLDTVETNEPNMKPLRTQRLWLVTALFVAIVGVILLIAVQQATALSDVRAYTTGEGLYSKAQKRAVIGLLRYARSRAEADYRVFTESIAVPIGDRDARHALQREEPDLDAAVDGFLRGNNHAEDVAGMARFFIRFDWISYVADAIRIWTLADAEVAQLVALGEELHRRIGTGNATEAEVGLLLAKVVAVDERLTILEDRFSDTLGHGERRQLEPGGYPGLAEDAGEVVLDCLIAD